MSSCVGRDGWVEDARVRYFIAQKGNKLELACTFIIAPI